MIKLNEPLLNEGVEYITGKDFHLASIVETHGPPPLWDREEGFPTLIRIILEQQVSLASAKAAYDKLERNLITITPGNLLRLSDEELKRTGFSRQKTRYARELAQTVLRGDLDLTRLGSFENEEVKKRLTRVTGIGSWTADIYLLMALGRPDIWPRGDLALATAYRKLHAMDSRPGPDELQIISIKWKPWRAVAARLLWHYYLSEGG